MEKLDDFDRAILRRIQVDASISIEALAEQVRLSRNACWRRVKLLEERGVIKRRVALVDAEKVGLELSVLVMIRTDSHDPEWLTRLREAVLALPQILGAYRMTGDLDYVLRVRVDSVRGYDALYQELIRRVPIADVSASFVMEEIKNTTVLPL